MTLKHYAEYRVAGSFMSEEYSIEISHRFGIPDVPEEAIAFRFYSILEETFNGETLQSKRQNESNWFHWGKIVLREDVKNEGDTEILYSNMHGNDIPAVVMNYQGAVPLQSGEIVLGTRNKYSWA